MRTWEEIREDFPILKEKIHGKDLIYLAQIRIQVERS